MLIIFVLFCYRKMKMMTGKYSFASIEYTSIFCVVKMILQNFYENYKK